MGAGLRSCSDSSSSSLSLRLAFTICTSTTSLPTFAFEVLRRCHGAIIGRVVSILHSLLEGPAIASIASRRDIVLYNITLNNLLLNIINFFFMKVINIFVFLLYFALRSPLHTSSPSSLLYPPPLRHLLHPFILVELGRVKAAVSPDGCLSDWHLQNEVDSLFTHEHFKITSCPLFLFCSFSCYYLLFS